MDTNTYINYIMSFLLKKIVVPSQYHAQVQEIQNMLKDDLSGLVDSLTDFAVDSAVVDYNIVTGNDNLDGLLKKWLKTINAEYNGQIPMGIRSLSKEYFKERWKNGSFPVLKIQWGKIDGLVLPTKMFFVDGSSIHAKEKEDESELSLLSYDYYIGRNFEKKYKLAGDNVIINRPFGRWFDKYPTPYLIKRGIFHNWKIIQSLKNKEIEILEQIIPYMLLIKKGTEQLATEHIKMYSDPELKEVKRKFQKLMDDIKTTKTDNHKTKTPVRATTFDEVIEHIIPNLENLFKPTLFASAERNILAGLGFIDVVEGVSTSRRESILNPKAFIEEVKTGVDDFKAILEQLVYKIIKKNENKRNKYMNLDFYITSSPVRGFMTDDFKKLIRLMWKAGKISSQTAVELIAEVDFKTEVMRMDKENEDGLRERLYPQLTENVEDRGQDTLGDNPDTETDEDGNPIPDDKKGDERKDYDIGNIAKCSKCGHRFNYTSVPESGMGWVKCPKCENAITQKDLEGAPYSNIKELPKRVRKNMSASLQRIYLKTFNNAYKTYKSDSKASKVAWSVISKMAHKNKDGKWVKNSARAKLTKSVLEKAIDSVDEEIIVDMKDETMQEVLEEKKLQIAKMKEELLKKLLKPKEE